MNCVHDNREEERFMYLLYVPIRHHICIRVSLVYTICDLANSRMDIYEVHNKVGVRYQV